MGRDMKFGLTETTTMNFSLGSPNQNHFVSNFVANNNRKSEL